MDKKIAIVGAGIGGLSIAARLSSRGFDVEIYEKLSECGGRAHIIEDKGFKFDTGPSFVLMPDFFQEVFTYCNKNISDYLSLKTLDISYKIFYPDGRVLTVYKDSTKTKSELEKFEKGAAAKYDAFIKEVTNFYNASRPLLYKCFTKKDLFQPKYWSLLFKLKPFNTYWQIARKFFKSDELCYAFTFEAMFIGVSPFDSPALYSVISYTDHVQKIAHPMGGMYEIPKALERICIEKGVKLNYNCEVKRIEKNNGSFSLNTSAGKRDAQKVVINADYSSAQINLLGRSIPDFEYSCSVYLLYLGLKQRVPGLEHHNLFFSKDLRKNLKQIFGDSQVPEDPSFYIHAPTVTDPSLAPEGKEIVYILIPVMNLEDFKEDFSKHEDKLRRIVFDTVKEKIGIDLEDLIEVEHRFYPDDFIKRYNIHNGATFGLAHTLMQTAFFRPANIDPRFKDLYYVGASTQPGGGLPPVIASSRIVADLITSKDR